MLIETNPYPLTTLSKCQDHDVAHFRSMFRLSTILLFWTSALNSILDGLRIVYVYIQYAIVSVRGNHLFLSVCEIPLIRCPYCH